MNADRPDLSDASIERLLDELPLEPLPAHFVPQLMQRISYQPQPFRIRLIDVLTALLLTLASSFGLFSALQAGGLLTVGWLPQLDMSWLVPANGQWLALSLLILIVELFIGIAIFYGFADGPAAEL